MSTPLSFCDISTRYGQAPAPRQTPAEQAGWDFGRLTADFLEKVQTQREKSAKEDEEDALMAMIDALNASEEDKASGKVERTLTESLAKAGKAISERYNGQVAPEDTLTVQAILACLGDRFSFEQVDKIQENQEQAREDREQEVEEERLEVTEQREPGDTEDPEHI